MPWQDQTFMAWIGSLATAAITALVAMVFKNHYSLQKHQAWVKDNFTNREELCEKLDEKISPIKDQMQSQDSKIELILEHLLEKQNAIKPKVDKS